MTKLFIYFPLIKIGMETKDVIKKKHKTSAHRHVRSMSSNVDVLWTHNKKKPADFGKPPQLDLSSLKASSSTTNISQLTSEDTDGPFYEVDLNEEVKQEGVALSNPGSCQNPVDPDEGMKRSKSKKIISTLKDLFTTSPRKTAPIPVISPKESPRGSPPNRSFIGLTSPRDSPPPRRFLLNAGTPREVTPRRTETPKEESSSGSSGHFEIQSPREYLDEEYLLRVYKKGRWWEELAKDKREVEKVTNLRLLYDEYKRNDSLPYINKQHEDYNPHLTSSQHLIIETIATLDNFKIYQYFLTIKYLMMWDKSVKLDQTLDFSLVDYYIIVHYSFDDVAIEDVEVDYYYPRSFFLAPVPAGVFDKLTIYPITLNKGKLKVKSPRTDIDPLSYRELIELFRDGKYRRIAEERRRTSYYIEFLLFSTADFILSSFDM